MRIRKVLAIIVMVWGMAGIGCTVYPPPRIDNMAYKNFEYEFKFKMPLGWSLQKGVPEEFTEGRPWDIEGDDIVTLTSPNVKGAIVVAAGTSEKDILWMSQQQEKMKEQLDQIFAEREKRFTEDGAYTYSGEVSYLEVSPNYAPSLLFREVAESESEVFVRDEYLYRCQNEKTCELKFILICPSESFDADYAVFEKLTASADKMFQ